MSIHPSLSPAVLREVTSLNRQFIATLVAACDREGIALDPPLHRALTERLRESDDTWPGCPFLLFGLTNERDGARGLSLDPFLPGVSRLVTVTLGLLWQLARDNRPAACAVSGCDVDWCDALAGLSIATLAELSRAVALRPRLIDVPDYWHDMARRRGISALQRMSHGPAGMQLILSNERRTRARRDARRLLENIGTPEKR